jgi:hypothetical protein
MKALNNFRHLPSRVRKPIIGLNLGYSFVTLTLLAFIFIGPIVGVCMYLFILLTITIDELEDVMINFIDKKLVKGEAP